MCDCINVHFFPYLWSPLWIPLKSGSDFCISAYIRRRAAFCWPALSVAALAVNRALLFPSSLCSNHPKKKVKIGDQCIVYNSRIRVDWSIVVFPYDFSVGRLLLDSNVNLYAPFLQGLFLISCLFVALALGIRAHARLGTNWS